MKKNTPFLDVLNRVLTEKEVKELTELVGYRDTATKATVYTLLQYWAMAAHEKWSGYRSSERHAKACGLPVIDYSSFSSRAAAVPFDLFKRVFHLLVSKCNRQTRRQLKFPKDLLLVDSTTVTAGASCLPWAPYKKFRSGIKLHTALSYQRQQLIQVAESIAKRNDAPYGEVLANPAYILVQDRAYGKIERLDRYVESGQSFVIRLKDNLHLVQPRRLKRLRNGEITVLRDITCRIGQGKYQSTKRHRVIEFEIAQGEVIRLVTDLRRESADTIAEIYKTRWQIEVFFRWVKQHLNVPKLFGTTTNAVYGQLYSALSVYVIMKWVFDEVKPEIPSFCSLHLWEFVENWKSANLPIEWRVKLDLLSKNLDVSLTSP